MKVAREKAAHYVQEKMTDDFSSETKRTTDSRTTFVKQKRKKKLLTSILYPVKVFFSLKMKQRYFLFKN